jgi:hypothetical protein
VHAVPGRRPLAVLVGGAPGSGKTTLSALLADALDLPVVHKDRLVHGAWRTRDRALELGAPAVEPFFRTLELWLTEGVSLVADHTFQRGVSDPMSQNASGHAPNWCTSTAEAGTRSPASNNACEPILSVVEHGCKSSSRWRDSSRPS